MQYDIFLPQPRGKLNISFRLRRRHNAGCLPSAYNLGLSHAPSQESTWIHRFCCSEYTSVHTWSSAFHTHLTRPPTARHNMLKQFAHSPHRPLLVCSNAHTSPYRGNRSYARHASSEQRYSSTRAAPLAASSGVAGVIPSPIVGAAQREHGGLLTKVKKVPLNHLRGSQISQISYCEVGDVGGYSLK